MKENKNIAKKKLLIKRVKEEAKKLRQFASPEELRKLNFQGLDPARPSRCIYGQMTGKCYTPRAHYLIRECCERVYHVGNNCDFEDLNYEINGILPQNVDERESIRSEVSLFSPIETFIATRQNYTRVNQRNGNNEKLVKYLKGETNELNLELW